MALRAGMKVGFLSGRKCAANAVRAAELGVTFCREDIINKGEEFEKILQEYNLKPEEVLYVGDDVIDIPVMRRAGVSVAPADCVPVLDKYIDWKCQRNGGCGVICEVIERLYTERGELDKLLERYCGSLNG